MNACVCMGMRIREAFHGMSQAGLAWQGTEVRQGFQAQQAAPRVPRPCHADGTGIAHHPPPAGTPVLHLGLWLS